MPDKYPIGLNINMGALRSWQSLVDTCKLLNSKYHLARIAASNDPRNDIDSVVRLHAAIGDPTLMWIIRVYDPREGEWFRYDVDRYVNYCEAIAKVLPNVIFDAQSNEPGVPPNTIDMFVRNQLDLIRKFKAKGLRYAAMCYGVGSPEWTDVMGGRFDDILREAEYISEHHYTMGWLEAGSGFGYEILLDPANLSQYWLEKWPIRAGHYLVRRSDYWYLRCMDLGIPMPTVLLAEAILDQIPDAVTKLNENYGGAWDSMRYQYGLPEFNYDLRGLNTYPEYYKAVFPTLTYDEALAKVHIHYVEDCLYVEYIDCAVIFAWDINWDIPMGTDASRPERRRFFELLSQHAKTYTKNTLPEPPPPIPPALRPVAVTGFDKAADTPTNVNIRSEPSIKSPKVGELPAKPTITYGYVWTDDPIVTTYTWNYYELNVEGRQVYGYIAAEFVQEVVDKPDTAAIVDRIEAHLASISQLLKLMRPSIR